MELWIRSQEKDILIKVDNLELDDERNDIYTHNCINNMQMTYTLGRYKTKERALEVLDEISLRISTINLLSLTTCSEDLKLMVKALTKERFKGITRPYEMPKE